MTWFSYALLPPIMFLVLVFMVAIAVVIYGYRNRAPQSAVVDDTADVSWFMLSPDNTSVECTECPTSWPIHPNEELQLFATLRQHGREHAG